MTEPLKDGYKQINPTRCPHCGVSRPSMHLLSSHKTNYFDGKAHEQKSWSTYSCSTCGGVALTRTPNWLTVYRQNVARECYSLGRDTRTGSGVPDSGPRKFKRSLRGSDACCKLRRCDAQRKGAQNREPLCSYRRSSHEPLDYR